MTIDGVDVGFIDYRLSGNNIVLAYIEIDPAFGGQGFGGRLTQAALDDCRSRGLDVTPACPFIADYMRRHGDAAPGDGRRRRWFRNGLSKARDHKD
jgi:predicted GNAT family acetyltransferase